MKPLSAKAISQMCFLPCASANEGVEGGGH